MHWKKSDILHSIEPLYLTIHVVIITHSLPIIQSQSQQVLPLHKIGPEYLLLTALFIYSVAAVGFHGLVIDDWLGGDSPKLSFIHCQTTKA